ncbi:MAG: hypothetical protein ACREVW_07640 [Burkholderiales bacterium]
MASSPHDSFRPRHEPARAIYDAFQAEAAKRKGRPLHEWIAAERHAVWLAAQQAAELHGLYQPTPAEIDSAERYARGSIAYGAKWAYQVVARMRQGARA